MWQTFLRQLVLVYGDLALFLRAVPLVWIGAWRRELHVDWLRSRSDRSGRRQQIQSQRWKSLCRGSLSASLASQWTWMWSSTTIRETSGEVCEYWGTKCMARKRQNAKLNPRNCSLYTGAAQSSRGQKRHYVVCTDTAVAERPESSTGKGSAREKHNKNKAPDEKKQHLRSNLIHKSMNRKKVFVFSTKVQSNITLIGDPSKKP